MSQKQIVVQLATAGDTIRASDDENKTFTVECFDGNYTTSRKMSERELLLLVDLICWRAFDLFERQKQEKVLLRLNYPV